MKPYTIVVREVISKHYLVEANSAEEAWNENTDFNDLELIGEEVVSSEVVDCLENERFGTVK